MMISFWWLGSNYNRFTSWIWFMVSNYLTLHGTSYALAPWMRWIDRLMYPLMYILGGCSSDVQYTHPWHVVAVSCEIDSNLTISTISTDPTRVLWAWLPFFHMPIIGWWSHYVVLQTTYHQKPWFIGRLEADGSTRIHKLPLDDKVKVLVGPKGNAITFFWLDKDGKQISLQYIAYSKVWDIRYIDIPLYMLPAIIMISFSC